MLLRQNSGRHQHGHLPPAHHRLERRPNGHLGFAKTNVTADKSIHRARPFHVLLGRLDGRPLVAGFLVRERPLELPLPRRVPAVGVPRLSLARCLNFQQIRREIGDGLLGIGLGLAPAFAAEDAQRRLGLAGADVFADEVRLRHRHEQPGRFLFRIACAELDHEAFLSALGFLAAGARRARLHRQDLQPKITPDAVLQMHDVIAHTQVGKIDFKRRAGGGGVGRLEPARPLRSGSAKDFRVGDDDQLGRLDEEPP